MTNPGPAHYRIPRDLIVHWLLLSMYLIRLEIPFAFDLFLSGNWWLTNQSNLVDVLHLSIHVCISVVSQSADNEIGLTPASCHQYQHELFPIGIPYGCVSSVSWSFRKICLPFVTLFVFAKPDWSGQFNNLSMEPEACSIRREFRASELGAKRG